MKIEIVENQWESNFFQRSIGKINFLSVTDITADNSTKKDFELLQTKVYANELEKISFLQQQGFQLVEGEVDFCLALSSLAKSGKNIEIATLEDIPTLMLLFGQAFPTSRFRTPWFSLEENQRFYQTWIVKAVKGEFDHLCLVAKEKGKIKGGVSLRLNERQARIGLLAVDPEFQGQGIAKALLQNAVQWAQAQGAENLWIATQISNLVAINLYQKFGAKTASTSYWFYK